LDREHPGIAGLYDLLDSLIDHDDYADTDVRAPVTVALGTWAVEVTER
jgi:hypothetical protein